MKTKLKILICLALIASINTAFAVETTVYGKIVGIETRAWGLHVQTNFAGGTSLNCSVNVGDTYMYDFRYDSIKNSQNANLEKSVLLAAFSSGKEVSFHLYECNSNNSRPIIGYIRIR